MDNEVPEVLTNEKVETPYPISDNLIVFRGAEDGKIHVRNIEDKTEAISESNGMYPVISGNNMWSVVPQDGGAYHLEMIDLASYSGGKKLPDPEKSREYCASRVLIDGKNLYLGECSLLESPAFNQDNWKDLVLTNTNIAQGEHSMLCYVDGSYEISWEYGNDGNIAAVKCCKHGNALSYKI